MRMRLEQRLAQSAERIVGQLVAEHVRERAQDRPVLARIAGRERGAAGHLHPSLGVDVDGGFLRIGGARQDDVGAVGAAVAVGADIDDEGAGRDLDLVGAEQERDVEGAGRRHLAGSERAGRGHEAEVERADLGGRGVQDREAVPAVRRRAEVERGLGGERGDRRAVAPRQRPHADDDQRPLGFFQRFRQRRRGRPRPRPASRVRRRDSRK